MKRVKARPDGGPQRPPRRLETWLDGMKGCTVFAATPASSRPTTVRVGDAVLSAEKIFINVGGRANIPDMPGRGSGQVPDQHRS
jgi:pyruvate/2-oxoglutarate dehydrogenase complex dihydrolipoamide dehydrogenase (E3) component